ncbi:2Fe-2S iron-sulfur cluster-binding protein [Pseudomonas putida]|uniref:Chloroplast-type ferredoxin n=1 Tax=Pseudomonas putida TaxID=303 RepID=A0A1L7NN81_PSEPU|nr:2Fe-2S iron-sulfur cluster binding domain-containing protein [Pseudomonas putida]BAW21881.1 chloroplast-type ferredoxin [Pseudomonas putida]BAW26922.1 chloroplast-type ferredoxin [Pseudomonas putida]BAW26935.1 chloroplast-type ferredoxin [Pseudomonas putida]
MTRFQVSNCTTGDVFTCHEGQSVLKAMEKWGVKCVPVGCRGGGCGFCKVRVVEGEYRCGKMSKVHAPPEAVEKGEVLACRIYPLTDLTIECVPLPEAALVKETLNQTS